MTQKRKWRESSSPVNIKFSEYFLKLYSVSATNMQRNIYVIIVLAEFMFFNPLPALMH
jgi:hypothetical protein